MKDLRQRIGKFLALLGRKNTVLLFLGIFVGIAWFVTETAFIYVIQLFFVAIGLMPAQVGFISKFPKSLFFACAALLAFAVFRFLVTAARSYLAVVTQQSFVYHIRKQLATRALQGEVSLSAHDVISLFSQVTSSSGLFVYNLVMLIVGGFASLFFIGAAFWIAPFEATVGIGIFLLLALPMKYGVQTIGRLGKVVHSEWENVNYELSTAIKNKFLLKLYGTVDTEVGRCGKSLRIYFEQQKKFAAWLGLLNAAPILVGVFSIIAVTLISSKFSTISPMGLTAFLYILMRLAQVASETNSVLSSVRFFVPSVQALYDWLYRKQPPVEVEEDGVRHLTKIKSLRCENVDFAFDRRTILSNLNFEVRAGDCLAIIGQSGSGKSTLLSVLLGLLRPAHGKILVEGHPIQTLHPSWRDKVAYVGPDPFTIEGTLRENLLYGNKRTDVDDQHIWKIIEAVGLKRDFSDLADGLDYYLKAALRFSSGQLQRLSIARALLRDFDILVFDEGTANLDAMTAKMILSRVREMTKNKIFIRVTHQGVDPSLEKVIELGIEPTRQETSLATASPN